MKNGKIYSLHNMVSEKGIRPAEEMQEGMRKNVKPHSPAVDCIWWKKDDNHHQSIMIYSSEESANQHRAQLEEFRKNSSSEYSIKMVEETMGPLIAQLSNYNKNKNFIFVTVACLIEL